jgi:hypothetical protein
MVGLCFARGIYIVVRATQCESCPLCTCRTGQAGGVITKSYIEQTNNALVCSLCPQCNARRGYRVPRGDWYLAIRVRRASPPRQPCAPRPLGATPLLSQSILKNRATPLLPQNWYQITGIKARPTKKPSGPKKMGAEAPEVNDDDAQAHRIFLQVACGRCQKSTDRETQQATRSVDHSRKGIDKRIENSKEKAPEGA